MKTNLLLIFIFSFYHVNAQTCKIIDSFLSPGTYNVSQQLLNGFCSEWIVGRIIDDRIFLVHILNLNVNCVNGDQFYISNEDRTKVLYNHCSPILLQLSNAVLTEGKYVFLTLKTSRSNYLTISFGFYIIDPSKDDCGNPDIKPNQQAPRIIGGIEAIPNSWPWQVYISDNTINCSASLIGNSWLLTAAHCTEGTILRNYKAYLGLHNIKNKESAVIRSIIKAIRNKNYGGPRKNFNDDIALLKLSSPVEFSKTISPICLPNQGENLGIVGSAPYVIGWGLTADPRENNPQPSDVLRQVNIAIQPGSYCLPKYNISDNQICAGRISPIVIDSCDGDSGGPVMTKKNNSLYYLTGIVSYGDDRCSGTGVYTKVSNYIDWIFSTVRNESN